MCSDTYTLPGLMSRWTRSSLRFPASSDNAPGVGRTHHPNVAPIRGHPQLAGKPSVGIASLTVPLASPSWVECRVGRRSGLPGLGTSRRTKRPARPRVGTAVSAATKAQPETLIVQIGPVRVDPVSADLAARLTALTARDAGKLIFGNFRHVSPAFTQKPPSRVYWNNRNPVHTHRCRYA